jgi:hypothetical protein
MTAAPGRTTRLGYGAAHQRERRRVAEIVARGGVRCWRCGRSISPAEPWHLGHADTWAAKRFGIYAGPEHAMCSWTAGGWKRQGRIVAPRPVHRPRAKALEFFD